jgi:putative oligomerization/nucleic acid binding protein/uncharacterized protein DUF4429
VQGAGRYSWAIEMPIAQLNGAVMEPTKTAAGVNGQLELYEDKIRIKRKGVVAFLGHGLKGDKDILLSQISSLQFKKAGLLVNGYLQIAFVGGTEPKGSTFQAVTDENTVLFNTGPQKVFDDIKAAIERKMVSARTPAKASSFLDDLEKLAALRDKGIITDAEFAAKKRQLLGL